MLQIVFWCVNRFFQRASSELQANIRRTFGDAPADFRQTPGLLRFVPAEPPTTVRTSVELSNSQRDHSLDSGATPAACLTSIVVNPTHVKQNFDRDN